MLLSMIITLYTSRVILNTLGVVDYGIYNLIGGVAVMFGFLSNAMAASTQRFLSFEIGKGGFQQLKDVFNSSILLHIFISLFVLLSAEIIGPWFIREKLNLPIGKIPASIWVFRFSIWALIITILTIPYYAAIIAHERMKPFAYISIIETLLKLIIVYLLVVTSIDKLIFYSFLVFLVTFLIRLIYIIYCLINFKETHLNFTWDPRLIKKMTSFAGWNLFGVFAGIGYNQGISIILNIYFGPIVNAARGIAYQVMGAVNSLVSNFQTAVNPPITKAYALEDEKNLYSLVFISSKYSFILLLLFSLPMIIEMDIILALWLKNTPTYAVSFTRLILLDTLVCSISGSLQMLVQATGKVKKYQLIISLLLLSNLPISYLLLSRGAIPESTFIVSIIISAIALCARLLVLKSLLTFPIHLFFVKVISPIFLITLLSWELPSLCRFLIGNPWIHFPLVCITSTISITLSYWLLGSSFKEKEIIKFYVKKYSCKICQF